MKKLVRMLAVFVVTAVMGVSLVACDGRSRAEREGYDFFVGINQFLRHPALDMVSDYFMERLTEMMDEYGYTVGFDFQVAGLDAATARTISNNFVASRVCLIFAIATPSAQASRDAAEEVGGGNTPVVFGTVTDPEGSGLVGMTNITGTSDALDMATQIGIIADLLGDEVGGRIAYIHSNEPNSRTQGELLAAAGSALGVEVVQFAITDIGDLQTVFTAIAADTSIRAIYIGNDNRIASNMSQVRNLNYLSPRSLPIVVADLSMAEGGAIAAYALDYAYFGRVSAELAFEVLVRGRRPIDVPIYRANPNSFQLLVNQTIADEIGFVIPAELLERADIVV